MRHRREAPTGGIAGAVHALGSTRLAAHAGDGWRREAAAEGLVQDDLGGAALDMYSIVVVAPPRAHPTPASAMIEYTTYTQWDVLPWKQMCVALAGETADVTGD